MIHDDSSDSNSERMLINQPARCDCHNQKKFPESSIFRLQGERIPPKIPTKKNPLPQSGHDLSSPP